MPEPHRESFLLCRPCAALLPLAPLGPWHDTDAEAAAELAAFQAVHAAHGIETAERVDEPARIDRPAWDPLATRWFQVATDGDVLVVRSSRTSAEAPRRYELTPDALPPIRSRVDVDEPLLRRALDRHFFPHVIRPAELEAFVSTVRELLAPVDPAEIDTAFDDPSLPDAAIGPFPPGLAEHLIERCATFLDPVGLERARSFVRDHRAEDGALAVRVHRILVTRAA
jgi:hypothetical protein